MIVDEGGAVCEGASMGARGVEIAGVVVGGAVVAGPTGEVGLVPGVGSVERGVLVVDETTTSPSP